ncbi:hypothetical protein AMECASPLE_012135 [Ameca splendens]|uniref:Uncharacterized protein n=1 Tax=Ameca splendens TaxID=208324 RepID=A0ABV0ZB45_9TELE
MILLRRKQNFKTLMFYMRYFLPRCPALISELKGQTGQPVLVLRGLQFLQMPAFILTAQKLTEPGRFSLQGSDWLLVRER